MTNQSAPKPAALASLAVNVSTERAPTGRKCDVCGKGATPRKGGVWAFAREGYAHLSCFRRKRARRQP